MGEDLKEGYFTPSRGNVIFASALDGWAFRLIDFARLYHKMMGLSVDTLSWFLWGDYSLNPKTKKIVKRKQNTKGGGGGSSGRKKDRPSLFVQFVLKNIWEVCVFSLVLCACVSLALIFIFWFADSCMYVPRIGLQCGHLARRTEDSQDCQGNEPSRAGKGCVVEGPRNGVARHHVQVVADRSRRPRDRRGEIAVASGGPTVRMAISLAILCFGFASFSLHFVLCSFVISQKISSSVALACKRSRSNER